MMLIGNYLKNIALLYKICLLLNVRFARFYIHLYGFLGLNLTINFMLIKSVYLLNIIRVVVNARFIDSSCHV